MFWIEDGLPGVGVDPSLQVQVPGTTARFDALVDGVGTSYQWFHGGTALADGPDVTGSRSPSLVLRNISGSSAGAYTVRVSNSGAVSSPPSELVVLETFSQWADRLGLAPGSDAPADPFFTTGTRNLIAYATGIQPDGVRPFDLPSFGIEAGEAVIAFWRPRSVRDIEYRVDFSSSLGEWLELDAVPVVRQAYPDGDILEVRQALITPCQFYRLRVFE